MEFLLEEILPLGTSLESVPKVPFELELLVSRTLTLLVLMGTYNFRTFLTLR